LINTDDITLFGVGSEWFWAMLTMIALTVTFVAIYRQLRAQRAAVAFDQLQALELEWRSDRMTYNSHRLAVGLRRGDDWEKVEQFLSRAEFFDKLALLHRQGYLDTEVLYTTFGEDIVRWWTVTESVIKDIRAAYESPGELSGFERLAAQMRRMMAARGVPEFKTDPESIKGRLDWIIEGDQRRRQYDEEFKTWTVPEPEPTPRRDAAAPIA
jgi:hypothetical protein